MSYKGMPEEWPPPVPGPSGVKRQESDFSPGWRGWLQRLLYVPPGNRTVWEVIVWWERRRITVNLIIGGVGFVSLILFLLFITASGTLKPGEDAVEPMALILAPFAFNFFYTAGWVVELFARLLWPGEGRSIGPALLGTGLVFSLFIVCLPSFVSFLALLGRFL